MKNAIALFNFYVVSEWYENIKTEHSVIHTEIRKLCVLLCISYRDLKKKKELPEF
jgi:hypothetical protein